MRKTIAVTLLVGMLAGCATQAGESEEEGLSPFLSHLDAEVGDARQKALRASFLREEELVAECMAEAGFEYFPSDDNLVLRDVPSLEEAHERFRNEGWGIFTGGPGEPSSGEEPTSEPSRQERYLESLTAQARDEYERVLTGSSPLADDSAAADRGCEQQAADAAGVDQPEHVYADLLEEIRAAQQTATSDPLFLEELSKYRSCMAAAGYPGIEYDGREIVVERFEEELRKGPVGPGARRDELAAWELEVASTELDCLDRVDLDAAHAQAVARIETEIMARRAADVAGYIDMLREYESAP